MYDPSPVLNTDPVEGGGGVWRRMDQLSWRMWVFTNLGQIPKNCRSLSWKRLGVQRFPAIELHNLIVVELTEPVFVLIYFQTVRKYWLLTQSILMPLVHFSWIQDINFEFLARVFSWGGGHSVLIRRNIRITIGENELMLELQFRHIRTIGGSEGLWGM